MLQSWTPCPGNDPTHKWDGASHSSQCNKHAQKRASQVILDFFKSKINFTAYSNSALGEEWMIQQLIAGILVAGAGICLDKQLTWILQWRKKWNWDFFFLVVHCSSIPGFSSNSSLLDWLSNSSWMGPPSTTRCLEQGPPLQVSVQLLVFQAQQEDSGSSLGGKSHVGWRCCGITLPAISEPTQGRYHAVCSP